MNVTIIQKQFIDIFNNLKNLKFVVNNRLTMKKLLLILLCLPIFYSACQNHYDDKKNQNSIAKTIVSFNVTSKNSDLTSKSGKNVSLQEMTTIQVKSGDNILFRNFNFTLDNNVSGALNFFTDNGDLICNVPTELSVMSMPPNGKGLTNYIKGDNIKISGTTLIKLKSTNFVVSDIVVQ